MSVWKISITMLVTSLSLMQCASLLGIRKIKKLSDQEIIQAAENMKIISGDPLYKINVEAFRNHFQKTNHNTSAAFKDMIQPLQIKAYDKNLHITLYLVNCYVGGLPKLKWNRLGTFDKFPLDQGLFFMPDSGRLINETLDFLVPLQGKIPSMSELSAYDISIFVYWAKFMNRHSKELINLLKHYQQQYQGKKIKTFYINTDNLLVYD